MADEKPRVGCLSQFVICIAVFSALNVCQFFFGRPFALGICVGALIAIIICLWEVGRDKDEAA